MESEINSSLRYMRLVRGGDSSVFAWIREEIAIWGRFMYKNKNVPITSLSDIAQTQKKCLAIIPFTIMTVTRPDDTFETIDNIDTIKEIETVDDVEIS